MKIIDINAVFIGFLYNTTTHIKFAYVFVQKPYQISLDFDLYDKTDLTSQLISYVLSVDFLSLHEKMQEFVTDWIKSNCFKVDSKGDESKDVYQMRQSVRMMLYTFKGQEKNVGL